MTDLRRIWITGTPPREWVEDAESVTKRLYGAKTEDERDAILREKEKLWRDTRIRDWLLGQFGNKCWYTESYDAVSSVHVDHYRPKGRVRDGSGSEGEGYWWLAFDWKNYRICGQLINVKKSDLFPLLEGNRAIATDSISLKLECPAIIDPISDRTRLISYERDEDACVAVPASGASASEVRVVAETVDILGLNKRGRLNRKRADFWDKALMAIADYEGSQGGPQVLAWVIQARVALNLRSMIEYTAEFSSVVEACIRKNASEALIGTVFDSYPSLLRRMDE